MKTISLKMPEALFEKLESTARERGESKSALLRELVQMTVVGKKNGDGSCLDLAKDWQVVSMRIKTSTSTKNSLSPPGA